MMMETTIVNENNTNNDDEQEDNDDDVDEMKMLNGFVDVNTVTDRGELILVMVDPS